MRVHTKTFTVVAAALMLAGCGDSSQLPETASTGPNPTLPAPNPTLVPTVDVAPAKGWPEGATPKAASDLAVKAFASGLDHPRWLHVLPNGDVLVAETNAPARACRARTASRCCATPTATALRKSNRPS